jgi:hypothetical protein
MRRLIVDRFEGDFAVCEQEDLTMTDIQIDSLPAGVHAGSVLYVDENGKFSLDIWQEEERRENLLDMQDRLFDD